MCLVKDSQGLIVHERSLLFYYGMDKNSRSACITASAPLLNLNLNYEKLQCKYMLII